MDEIARWVGRSETRHDSLGPAPLAALDATLDHPERSWQVGDSLPPLWHWLYFLPLHRHSDIGPDGHARRGAFLPPVALPRRMWAGSRFEFHQPLHLGDSVARTSTIESVQHKTGRSGPLVFVTVRHELHCNGAADVALREWHDIVYREANLRGDVQRAPLPAPADAPWQRMLVPDEVLLFRFSALTFNAHRVHFDRRYVTGVEGYPGLVVHGPLVALLLLDLLHQHAPASRVTRFEFKALRPCFDGNTLQLNGRPQRDGVQLWAEDHEGSLTMEARASLA